MFDKHWNKIVKIRTPQYFLENQLKIKVLRRFSYSILLSQYLNLRRDGVDGNACEMVAVTIFNAIPFTAFFLENDYFFTF